MDTLTDLSATPFYATGKRSRDLAAELGLSEAELLATHQGPEVVRLALEPKALVEALPALGEIMVLTRNDVAVHEKVGAFGGIHFGEHAGLVINPPIDLRLFPKHWASCFALELPDKAGPRRSIQIFDASGEAAIKIHLRAASDAAAFEAIRARFALGAPEPLAVSPYAAETMRKNVDADAFRHDFEAMADVHQFFPLLRRHGVSRRGALDLMGEAHVRPLGAKTATRLLEAASAESLPIMCFVGSRGCIQIHSGPVRTIRAMGPWINVLDPGFDLHLREDLVAEAFAVRKPTRDGLLTSVELFDAKGALPVQFFGVRGEGRPEDPRWRALVDALGASFDA
ncbi:hemin-degrading factor [Aureimonas sp. AU20]|uniref:hemin-degrading factor n=1 Tax=Aureimonas sp. AU20 TaxID=1349819 RepID=UPI0009EC1AB8|nr:ChuX/HutX family heme-like substrate-binding protein [Aureimonas sp. AU20]